MSLPPQAVPWRQIDTCVLDMDGTLLDLHFDQQVWNERLPERYGQRLGLETAAARERVSNTLEATRGTLQWYCMDHWSREFDIEMTTIEHELRHLIAVRPGTESFLNRMRTQKLRLILATNAHRSSLVKKLELTGIEKYFDEVVSSHDYGFPKEDQRFWQALQQRHAINVQSTVFIDDNLAVLKAAQDFGIRYLFGIAQPSSQGASVDHPGFHNLDCFTEFTQLWD